MSYIWQDYSPDTHFRVGERTSPYIETLDGTVVNPLLRFDAIFNKLSTLNALYDFDCYKSTTGFENAILHFLARLDLLAAFDTTQALVNEAERLLRDGAFGQLAANSWDKLSRKSQRGIAETLTERYTSHTEAHMFARAAQRVFAYITFLYESEKDIYYLYISDAENEEHKLLLDIITELFWDMENTLKVVWHKHYGILGCSSTMKISNITIV